MYMLCFLCFVLINVFPYANSYKYLGWSDINLHCRDNNNNPVPWWVLYKPPSDVHPYAFLSSGRNFTYITPGTAGRWQSSRKYITANSMLQYTLEPMYKKTYVDHLAVALYEERVPEGNFSGSTAYGTLMADEMGAIWIIHTVPGLLDLDESRPVFPKREIANGHFMMCLSIDLNTLNDITYSVKYTSPNFSYVAIPDAMKLLLPEWNFEAREEFDRKNPPNLDFVADDDLQISLSVRAPGDKRCLYRQFARVHKIVLDSYGQTDSDHLTSICGENYSVRNIESISVKLPDKVYYIGEKPDRMRFAVSTAAHWQSKGSGPVQYWTCISTLDKEDETGKGGIFLCIHNYNIWLIFDNLKTKEPVC